MALQPRFCTRITRRIPGKPLISLFITTLLFLALPLAPAYAEEERPPKPNLGTQADFYVSWNDGNDSNPGTLDAPFKTPGRAVDLLKAMADPSGKVVLIRGGTYRLKDHPGNRLKLNGLCGLPGAPIQFRGYPRETVLLDAFQKEFDPLAVPFEMVTGWGGISFNHSNHIIVENFHIQGCTGSNVELLDSNYITIRFIHARRSNQCGMFTGGSFHDLTIEGCKFYEQIYGNGTSHGIYISGGIWEPDLPPIRNVRIRYVESYFNGRHGIQLNGRIENIMVEHCKLHHNILGGLSLIGTRDVIVRDNVMYKNNKQGVILYTYFDDAYWDLNDPDSMAHWEKTHFTIENVKVLNNTIFLDDKPWYDDEWINYDPSWHAGVCLSESSGLLPPFKNIEISRNIIYTHSKMMIRFCQPELFPGAFGSGNVFYSEAYGEGVAVDGQAGYSIAQLEIDFPEAWSGNIAGQDPLFMDVKPTQLIDASYKQIDFSSPEYSDFTDSYYVKKKSPAWAVDAGAGLNPMAVAPMEIFATTQQKIPAAHGWDIANAIFNDRIKPELQSAFLYFFNPSLQCLITRAPMPEDLARLSFKNEDKKFISVAVLNKKHEPCKMQTWLTDDRAKDYTALVGVTFDDQQKIRFLKDLEIVDDHLDYTLGENSLGVILLFYE